MVWRRSVSPELAVIALTRFLSVPIHRHLQGGLGRPAWSLADELGWAKTYDAEYVAVAQRLECRLLTIDARLQRGAARKVEAIGPGQL